MSNLAIDYADQGKYADAEALNRQVLDIRRRVLGPEHPDTLFSMHNLALVLSKQGKYAQAEALFGQTLDIRRRVLGAGHPETFWTFRNLVSTLERENKYSEAEALFRQRLQSDPSNPASLNAMAWYLVAAPDFRQRRPAEALPLARLAVKGAPTVATYYNTLGLAAYRNDLWDEAIANLNRSVGADQGKDPTDSFVLAMAKRERGNAREADDDFARGVNGAKQDAADHWEWRMLWAEAAEVLGKPSPVPTFLEAQAEPERAMKALKREAAAGQLSLQTLQASPDLTPLRGRADFEDLLRDSRSAPRSVR